MKMMKSISEIFSENLRKLMEEQGILSQKELSEISGVSQQAIGGYIRGEHIIRLDAFLMIKESLGCSYEDLLEDKGGNL